MGMVAQVLRPARRALRVCLNKDPSEALTARVSLVVNDKGRVEGIFVTPNTMQQCVEPILRKYDFPSTQTGRQQIVHVIRGKKPAAAAGCKSTKRRVRPKRRRESL